MHTQSHKISRTQSKCHELNLNVTNSILYMNDIARVETALYNRLIQEYPLYVAESSPYVAGLLFWRESPCKIGLFPQKVTHCIYVRLTFLLRKWPYKKGIFTNTHRDLSVHTKSHKISRTQFKCHELNYVYERVTIWMCHSRTKSHTRSTVHIQVTFLT